MNVDQFIDTFMFCACKFLSKWHASLFSTRGSKARTQYSWLPSYSVDYQHNDATLEIQSRLCSRLYPRVRLCANYCAHRVVLNKHPPIINTMSPSKVHKVYPILLLLSNVLDLNQLRVEEYREIQLTRGSIVAITHGLWNWLMIVQAQRFASWACSFIKKTIRLIRNDLNCNEECLRVHCFLFQKFCSRIYSSSIQIENFKKA